VALAHTIDDIEKPILTQSAAEETQRAAEFKILDIQLYYIKHSAVLCNFLGGPLRLMDFLFLNTLLQSECL
jgi:hypothetical protein